MVSYRKMRGFYTYEVPVKVVLGFVELDANVLEMCWLLESLPPPPPSRPVNVIT
jgi:hypothetical protein